MNLMTCRPDHLTKYPIIAYRSIFWLQDRKGNRISFHRTKSGALRKRRELLKQDQECLSRSRMAA
jgi:hypothetical protein